jgi:hypothetical protein
MTTRKSPPPKPDLSTWIEIFKAGTHTDAKGNQFTFNQADIDQIIANHALGAVPAVLGHPKHDDRAWAWTADLKRDGDSLFTKFSDIDPTFAAGVESGAYRNRSVSVYKDPLNGWRMRHVGWLGATPPAIDLTGAGPANFSAVPEGVDVFEFAMPELRGVGWALDSAVSVFRSFREWIIAKESLEAADQVIPNYRITEIQSVADEIRMDSLSPAASFTGEPGMSVPTPEELARIRAELRAEVRTEVAAEFSGQVAASNQRVTALEAERRQERIDAQIAAWTTQGRVVPAEVAGLAEFMAQVDAAAPAEFEFSSSEGKPAKKTMTQWFTDFMSARQPVIKLGKIGGDDPPPAGGVDLSKAAAEFMQTQQNKGITVSAAEAVAHVSKQAGG